jgi:hypothetical protein
VAVGSEHFDMDTKPIKYGVEPTPVSVTYLQGMVGAGWSSIVERLVDDLFTLGWDGDVLQVKEKFGGLRFYINAQTDEMQKRRWQANDESYLTCEECGA